MGSMINGRSPVEKESTKGFKCSNSPGGIARSEGVGNDIDQKGHAEEGLWLEHTESS